MKPTLEPLEKDDKFIREFDDQNERRGWFICCIFEDKDGNQYKMCADQDGHEWTEEL
jgi:hypothetical protein